MRFKKQFKIMNALVKILYLFIILAVLLLNLSCDFINPPEKIPTYIAVDTIYLQTDPVYQGSSKHAISDCWLYVNNKLIGIFEVPFKVPVLESGLQSIQIEPGIKVSGSDSYRQIYPMMYGYYFDTVLTEGGVMTVNPVFTYRPATFALIEDFEDIGIAFEISQQSDTNIMILQNQNSLEGKSMYFALDNQRKNFECRTTSLYDLPKTGKVFLEVSFKSTDNFEFGIFSLEYTGQQAMEVRKRVYVFNPTTTWKRVYIDMNYFIINANGSQFRLYFTCSRPENAQNPKTEVYIDNIKLLYLVN